MISKSLPAIVTLLVVSLVCAAPVFGQAVFTVGIDSKTGADNGATELTGTIRLTVLSGTTVAAPMAVITPRPSATTALRKS